mgnify:CR=1 FL=1
MVDPLHLRVAMTEQTLTPDESPAEKPAEKPLKPVGKPVVGGVGYVQTDKAVHEKWVRLSIKQPAASALLHFFCGRLKANQAFVAAVPTLAKVLSLHTNTVRKAIAHLQKENWIQVVSIGKGQANAYVLNSRVAWQTSRDGMRYALFNGVVMADASDQDIAALASDVPLVSMPVLRVGEIQVPAGEGEKPPSQGQLDGVDLPDVPSIEQTDWVDSDFI